VRIGQEPQRIVTVNMCDVRLVEAAVMLGRSLVVVLTLLTFATPVAAGERTWVRQSGVTATTQPLPASSPFVVATKPFTASRSVANPLPESVKAVPDRDVKGVPDRRHRRHHPTTTIIGVAPAPQVIVVPQPVYYPVVVAAPPSTCVTPGYWSYRWLPYTATENVWVPGSWAADGTWTDSRWETRPYSSGYYEPFWTPDQTYAC
jgi:hypothetical protein